VADTGTGIPSSVLPRIFEPFFSTKHPTEGLGLGLSTVSLIVKRYKGFSMVETKLGAGSKFSLHFPALDGSFPSQNMGQEPKCPAGHGELVLVIDDAASVREFVRTALESFGYRVLAVQNGAQGLAEFKKHRKTLRLVISDSDLPVPDCLTAIREMKRRKPGLPVVMTNGANPAGRSVTEIGSKELIHLGKPFTVEQLLQAVSVAILPE
jgi:two-component system, cell cycle sensor histidine kinase and response regulator CckA